MWHYYATLPFWSRWFLHLRRFIAPHEWVLPHIKPEDHVLEVGGGHGLLSNLIKFQFPLTNVLATDFNKKRIAKACQTIQGRSGLQFMVANALPQTEDSFDVILFFDFLHHIPKQEDQAMILTQAKAILKPHGKIIVKEMFKEFSVAHFLNWLHDKILTLGEPTHYRTSKEWINLAKNLGFDLIHFQRGYKFWYHQFLMVLENGRALGGPR